MRLARAYCYHETWTIRILAVKVFFDQWPEGGLWNLRLIQSTALGIGTHFFLDNQDPIEVFKAVMLQIRDWIRDSLERLPRSARSHQVLRHVLTRFDVLSAEQRRSRPACSPFVLAVCAYRQFSVLPGDQHDPFHLPHSGPSASRCRYMQYHPHIDRRASVCRTARGLGSRCLFIRSAHSRLIYNTVANLFVIITPCCNASYISASIFPTHAMLAYQIQTLSYAKEIQCHATKSPCFFAVLARPAVDDFSFCDFSAGDWLGTDYATECDLRVSMGAFLNLGKDSEESRFNVLLGHRGGGGVSYFLVVDETNLVVYQGLIHIVCNQSYWRTITMIFP